MTDEVRRRVLIVEDEPRMGEVLGRAMPELGFAAQVVRSGEQALKAMAAEPAPIVLLDLNLPGMDGLECLRRLRERWPQTQAIVLTGFGDLEAAKRAIHLDVVEFLTKPCHLGELEIALGRAVARRRDADVTEMGEAIREGEALEAAGAAGGIDDGEGDEPQTLRELERKAILDSLARHDGNREKTASELGISVRTLYYRLREYQEEGRL